MSFKIPAGCKPSTRSILHDGALRGLRGDALIALLRRWYPELTSHEEQAAVAEYVDWLSDYDDRLAAQAFLDTHDVTLH